MKKYILGAMLSIGVLISPAFTQAAGLTTDQATVLINVVKASPSTPASAFVDLITAFSGITVNQAAALITVVQSSPATSASVFIPLLTSFTTDTATTQTTTQTTTQPATTQSTAVKSPTCTLNVAYGPGGIAKKYGLTGTGYYDGSGSTYVEIHDGEPVTVSWASTNADYSQGPGGDKDLANGSATYYPGGSKAYVWNFYGNGGYTSCGVMVEMFPNPDVPACALTASKNTAVPGDQITLSWTSKDAIYASWMQDSTANILGLPLDKLSDFGSQVITVAGKGHLTPTLSIFGKGGSSSCSATLVVSPLPTCTLTSKPYTVTAGEKTTLTWTSQNAIYATWQQDSSANVLGLSQDKLPVSGSQSIVIGGGKGNQTPTLLVYSSAGVGTCNTGVSIE